MDGRREDGELAATTTGEDDGARVGRAARAFDRLARAMSLAGEARSSGERTRSSALLDQAAKQYAGELDEIRATCERARGRCDEDSSMDAS